MGERREGGVTKPVTIHVGQVLDGLAKIPAGSVQCCVTSPPYWGLRSYLPDGVRIRQNLTDEQISKLLTELDRRGIRPIAE